MAFDTLDPAAALWRRFGLAWLLVPEELRQEPEKKPVYPERSRTAPVRGKAGEAERASTAPQVAAPTEIEWPESWTGQLARTPRGRIIWTYPGLGPDLLAARNGAAADPERKRRGLLLRNIAKDLGYPTGTHTFWPLLLDAEMRPDLFWAGCKTLGGRYIFVFGQDAVDALTGKPGLAVFSQWRGNGAIVWHLPAIDGVDGNAYGRLLAYIRSSLQPFRLGSS